MTGTETTIQMSSAILGPLEVVPGALRLPSISPIGRCCR